MQQSLRGRACAIAAVLSAVVSLTVLAAPPSPAQEDDGSPADTISIVKEDTTPSNAEVAVRLSESTPLPDTSTVLIGRDDEFADSLASGVLQATSPLLLVPSLGPVPDRVRAELARLDPERVILLGGEAALSPDVEQELAGLGYAVERRAGDSRFETATAIAAADAAGADTAILARAFAAPGATDPTQGFADALAAGGLAAERGWPVLLTQTEVLTGATRDHLVAAGIRTVKLMGGTAAISEAVEAELAGLGITAERIAGGSRAETAIEVAKARGAETAADAAHVVLVQGQTGDAWAGGFAAAAHSALLDAPIVLAVETQLPPATAAWLEGGATGGGTFAVDPSDGGAVLTCVTVPVLCEEARVTLGLPPAGPVAFSPAPGSTVRSGQPITATFAAPVGGQVGFGGTCITNTPSTPTGERVGVVLAVDVGVPAGPCTFTLRFTPVGGEEQLVEVTYDHSGEPSLELLTRTASGAAVGGIGPSTSDDGSVVAFSSDGPLVPGVAAGEWHAYVRDGAGVTMVDVTAQGAPAAEGGQLGAPDVVVSGQGRHVAFTSDDGTLDPQAELAVQISTYVRDLESGTTRHVSVDLEGAPVSRGQNPSISADGRVVTYTGQGATGVQEPCACTWMWWRDLDTGDIGRITRPDGTSLPAAAGRPQISADGRTIAFETSEALLPEDDNAGADAYVHDIATGELELVSVASDGTAGGSVDTNTNAEIGISGDGRFVAFYSSAGDLVAGEQAERGQVYLRDRVAGTTVRISQGGSGQFTISGGRPQIDDGGTWVAFASERSLFDATEAGCGVYRYDIPGGVLDRVDVGAAQGANTCPTRVDVAAGGVVVFDHLATLHAGDDSHRNASGGFDVYRSTPA
jgi:putative cell wall-binding protein/Tol biopolymer transport system component